MLHSECTQRVPTILESTTATQVLTVRYISWRQSELSHWPALKACQLRHESWIALAVDDIRGPSIQLWRAKIGQCRSHLALLFVCIRNHLVCRKTASQCRKCIRWNRTVFASKMFRPVTLTKRLIGARRVEQFGQTHTLSAGHYFSWLRLLVSLSSQGWGGGNEILLSTLRAGL